MKYEKPDYYTKLAKSEGYEARSIYKLKEMQEKFKMIKRGQKVLDLGCAPGSWSRYTAEIVGPQGLVVGIDYKQILVAMKNAVFIYGNFLREEKQNEIKEYGPYDGIISDMAPDTTGDRLSDCYKSSELVREALEFSYKFLKPGGFFIAKIFQGGDEKEIMEELKEAFAVTKWSKPKSTRKNSFEIFMIGMDFKGKPQPKEEGNPLDEDNYTGEMPW